MTAILKGKYVYLSEKPKKDMIGALRVALNKAMCENCLPIMRADIKRGQIKYQLPVMPEGFKVIKAEIDL